VIGRNLECTHPAHELRLESGSVWLFTLYMARMWGAPGAAVIHRGFKGLRPGECVGRRMQCWLQPGYRRQLHGCRTWRPGAGRDAVIYGPFL